MDNSSPAHVCLMTLDNTPSVHSFVLRSNSPYSSPRERAFGLIGYSYKIKHRKRKSTQDNRLNNKLYEESTLKDLDQFGGTYVFCVDSLSVGLTLTMLKLESPSLFNRVMEACRIFQHTLFPEPVWPTNIVECLVK